MTREDMTNAEARERIDIIITKHEVGDEYVTITNEQDYEALRVAYKSLESQKSGEWIYDGLSGLFTCPFCHNVHTFDYNYCPDCGSYNGAKMEAGE